MTESREFYAATVDEAVEKAASTAGTTPQELDVEVLDEGSSGFLGIGARDARILVRGLSPAYEPEQDDNDLAIEETTLDDEADGDVDASDGVEADGIEGTDYGSPEAQQELVLAADQFMIELMELMGFDGTVDVHDAGDVVRVEVTSAQTGLFIGQKGETIDAIQYLVNVAMYKDRPFAKRIVVDSEGYRQRRIEALQGMAHRVARRAQREKRPVSLPPMSAAERRVVHLFLQENPRVSTASEGQNEDRRVVVAPT